MIVLDTSAVIAFTEGNDRHHARARSALDERGDRSFVGPTTVLAEMLVQPFSMSQEAVARTEAALSGFLDVVPVTSDIARVAAEVRARSRLRLPDAVVIATGIELDAEEVLTFDVRWAGIDRRVTVLA